MYQCPFPDCDWSTRYPADVPLSIVVFKVDVQQHRKAHREDKLDENDDKHHHICGYCGREFLQRYDEVNPSQPCPQCRSRKKECECRAA